MPPPGILSTRKTSGEADFGAAIQCGSRTETARKPASLASQGVSEVNWPPEDAVPFTVVPVTVPMSCLPFILWSFARVGD